MVETVFHSEKPPIPSSIALWFHSLLLGFFFITWRISLKNGAITWSGLFILCFWSSTHFPFFDRNIVLTNKEICIKLWWCEDRIPLQNVVLVEPIAKPRMPLFGWEVDLGGIGFFSILPLGIILSKGTEWFFSVEDSSTSR